MKRIACLTALFLMALTTSVFAQGVQPIDSQVAAIVNSNQTPGAKVVSLQPLINAAAANRVDEKASYAKMMPKKDAIELAKNALDHRLGPHNDEVRNLNVETAQHNDWAARNQAAQNAHNASVCTAEEGSGACNWYDAEAARLNAEANRITAESVKLNNTGDYLRQEKLNLDEIQNNLSKDILEYTAWSKSYNADVQQNEANIVLLINTLKQILNSNAACQDAIKHSSDETMKEICGQMFDGNQIHEDRNPNQGTGTRFYGSGANPTNEQEPHN
jgi:hypothetical protein